MNLVFIMSDTFRADHLGCYGNKWIKTPNLDSFAQKSILFKNAYAEGLPTLPERTVLFTGKYTLPFRGWQPLWDHDLTISEILAKEGYATGLITDTYHMFKPGMNYHKGFDSFLWIRGQESDKYITDCNEYPLDNYLKPNWEEIKEKRQPTLGKQGLKQYLINTSQRRKEEDYFVAQVINEGIKWLHRNYKTKFFLWIDCFDPHEPWDPPDRYYRMYGDPKYKGPKLIGPWYSSVSADDFSQEEIEYIKALYAGEVSLVDHWINKLLTELEKLNLMKNTMVVFISDHGTLLAEHGVIHKAMHFKPTLYRPLVRIPLIIYYPPGPHHREIDELVWTPDVLPTVLRRLNIEIPEVVHGKDFWSIVEKGEATRNYIVSGSYIGHLGGNRRYITDGKWSCIHMLYDGNPELYNLEDDPEELKNIASKCPLKVKEMREKFKEFLSQTKYLQP